MIEKKDILTLDDNKEYVVVSKALYEDVNYFYIVDIDNVENFKFVKVENDNLFEIHDKDLATKLIPLFINDTGIMN